MYFHGVLSKRSDLVVDIDRDRLEARMLSYFDPTVTDEAMARICPMAMMDMEHFEPHSVRQKLLPRGYLPQYVVRHLYRPFDLRWLYWEPESELLARKVPEYFAQLPSRTRWIAAAHRHRKAFDPPPVTHALACLHVIEKGRGPHPGSSSAGGSDEPIAGDRGSRAGHSSSRSVAPGTSLFGRYRVRRCRGSFRPLHRHDTCRRLLGSERAAALR